MNMFISKTSYKSTNLTMRVFRSNIPNLGRKFEYWVFTSKMSNSDVRIRKLLDCYIVNGSLYLIVENVLGRTYERTNERTDKTSYRARCPG